MSYLQFPKRGIKANGGGLQKQISPHTAVAIIVAVLTIVCIFGFRAFQPTPLPPDLMPADPTSVSLQVK